MDRRDEPVFLICYHRSGSTYTMRLLNSCKTLAIYGEHEGIFNFLRDMSERMYERFGLIGKKSVSVSVDRLHGDVQTSWTPYANPFSYPVFVQATREYVKSLFCRDLPDGMRWGFKEIRYRSTETIMFMSEIFPKAHFVFLDREPTDLLASNVRAPWVINPKLKENGGQMDIVTLRKQVAKTMRNITEFRKTIHHCDRVLGHRALLMTYSEMNEFPEASVRRILAHIGEPQDSLDLESLASAKETKVGTEIKREVQPMFDRENLKRMARNWICSSNRGAVSEWIEKGKFR